MLKDLARHLFVCVLEKLPHQKGKWLKSQNKRSQSHGSWVQLPPTNNT